MCFKEVGIINQIKLKIEQNEKYKNSVVLVVDDNLDNRDILCRWLGRKNINTINVESGKEALEVIQNKKVDLVFLDLMMPNMSGYDVLDIIRKEYPLWKLPVIVATAKVDKDSILKAFNKGANDYITKPIIFPVAISRAQNLLVQKFLQEEIMEINSKQETIINVKTFELEKTISELKVEIVNNQKIEKELRLAKDVAEIASQTKSEFLANMSHELRTPLNAIIGFSEIMYSGIFGENTKDRVTEYSKDINDSAIHLLSIINDILDLSKIEAQDIELVEDEVNLQKLIGSALSILQHSFDEKEINLEMDCQCLESVDLKIDNDCRWLKSVDLKIDKRRFKQIILNLLSNALKFTPHRGKIKIILECCLEKGLTLTFQDTGIGISPENIIKVLEPFAQVESGLNRSYEGTGLGLPLVNALIEMHGGVFTLKSELNVGTTAIIWLPPFRIIFD